MQTRPRRRRRLTPSAALLVLGITAACAEPGSPPGEGVGSLKDGVDEVAAHHGERCPHKLPQASEESYGFGTSDPADSAPSLADPEAAWVCQYVSADEGPGADGDGTTFGWARHGPARRVPTTRLSVIAAQLRELVPADGEGACTADLGPRWMLVYTAGTDMTGVVVDGFGCQEVRLTDEPFRTVPGEASQAGTVPGVLTGPQDLLRNLETVHRRR